MSTRRKFSREFKSKVVLEALKERTTIEHLAKQYELQPSQISLWKSQALSNFGNLFHAEASNEKEKQIDTDKLYAQIGQLKVENDFLKKNLR
jgi:transposase-like protein